MKKLITALTVCAVAGFVTAAPVTSANIVGYKADVSVLAGNYNMLASPFTLVGGGARPIASLFTDNSAFIADQSADYADTITVWNGAGFDTYFFSSDAGNAWASGGDPFTETTDTIPVGGGFWFFRQGSALSVLTIVGEVVTTNVDVAVAASNYSMLANPFAAPLPIASISAPDFVADQSADYADTITVWNGAGFDTYFYSSDAGNAWAPGGDPFTQTDASIAVGGGFWLYRQSTATTVTLPVPFVL